jgi:CubicO group peptidase (beta-lactamase class C family)
VTERVTMSDLLSHRSGLAQHEWAWLAHPSESRAELLRRLPHLAFASDLRAAFHYCNLAFMLAGEVVAKVTGSTWEEQVRSRLLDPLGMTRTLTAMDDALHDHDHASPYDERDGTIAQIPWRPSDAVGPAGGIFSCADDTARWLLFQLGDGSVDGRRVLGEEGLRATQRTQFPFSHPSPFPEVTHSGYGFGWVQGTYRGRRMVWHNGGFDGFKTEFLLLPDEGIGIATCGATSHTSLLPQAVAHHVADLLLEEEPKAWSADMHELWSKARVAASETRAGTHVVPDAPPSHPLADYVASYDDPGYGTLEVVAKDEELQVRLGELDLVTRHRHFDTWTALYEALHTEFPITFVTDAEGVISEAVVPLEDAVPAVRFTRRIT